jgi:hypothetical protein
MNPSGPRHPASPLVALACCCVLVVGGGCSKKAEKEGGAAGGAAATTATVTTGEVKPAVATAPAEITCTKFATLDRATPKRPPITTTVKGARVPAGGTPQAKKPELFSIGYFDDKPVEVACTVRQQLEADKWTVSSMSGAGTTASPVLLAANKATAAIQVMVGPGDGPTSTVMVTAK